MRTKFTSVIAVLLLLFTTFAFAQKVVTGKVVDEKGQPLAGADVYVEGDEAITDEKGNFELEAEVGDMITVEYIGFSEGKKEVGASNTYSFIMRGDNVVEEVVYTGYTVVKKATSTGAESIVRSETIENRPNGSISQILQGQASGLTIGAASGQPGSVGRALLRGVNSINGNTSPLYIIDGIRVDEEAFRSFNPNEVETVNVLKDASEAALYGNDGANGVIVITTKKGTFGKKGVEFNYNSFFGINEIAKPTFEVMGSTELLQLEREAGQGRGAGMTNAQIAALANQSNTNWVDLITRRGLQSSHNLTVRSNGESVTSATTVGYFKQEGTVVGSDLQRFTLRNNSNVKSLDKRFNLSSTISLAYAQNNLNQADGGSLDNPFLGPYLAKPYLSPYAPDGSLDLVGDGTGGFLNTPFLALNTTRFNKNVENDLKLIAGGNASYKLTEDLTVSYRLGGDFRSLYEEFLIHPESLRGVNDTTENKGSYFEGQRRDFRFSNTLGTLYSKTFKEKHNVAASVYLEYLYSKRNRFNYDVNGINPLLIGSSSGFTPFALEESNATPYIPDISSDKAEIKQFSYFGQLAYDFDERFGAKATLRRDSSSRFVGEYKWGTFYSVGGFWNLHKENFMEDIQVFDKLKLRASYGELGNQRIQSLYYSGLYTPFTLYSQGASTVNNNATYLLNNLGNSDSRWERIVKSNIGLDFGLLQNKLTGSLDFYESQTHDLFLDVPRSQTTGFSSARGNLDQGYIRNRGIELDLRYKLIDKDSFKLSVYGNGSYNKTKAIDLGDVVANVNEATTQRLQNNSQIGEFFLVEWAGVNPANGRGLYRKLDGSLTETLSDADRRLTGKTALPIYQGGFGFNTEYKGFFLDTQFNYQADAWRSNGSLGIIEDTSLLAFANMSTSMRRRWQNPGDITDIPSLSYSNRLGRHDRYLHDASFLRLRFVRLGYNFDKKLLNRTPFNSASVSVQAENLLTWTKWEGFDPESSFDEGNFFDYPAGKNYTMSLSVKF